MLEQLKQDQREHTVVNANENDAIMDTMMHPQPNEQQADLFILELTAKTNSADPMIGHKVWLQPPSSPN